jgi:phenylalanyl-tRNA synthetase beta chain
MAGLEVEEICYVGLPCPEAKAGPGFHQDQRPVLGPPIRSWWGGLEVMPHPNADRLVLCRLDDGEQEHIVLTGAPNLFPYKGPGPLEQPLKVAYARKARASTMGTSPARC